MGRTVLHGGENVRVGVEGDGYGGVPERRDRAEAAR